jgi:hypothetical protein
MVPVYQNVLAIVIFTLLHFIFMFTYLYISFNHREIRYYLLSVVTC